MDQALKPRMSLRDKTTLLLLVLMSVFLFADQNIFFPASSRIMAEYGIGEDYLGIVTSSFTIVGALVSMLFGVLADRGSRKKLLVFVVLVGEIPCLLTGFEFFTQTYTQLLILRIMTGLGIGGIFPLTFSLIGDYFSAHHRPMANALVGAAWGIGQLMGGLVAGMVVATYGWRFPFILVALPNFALVPLFLLVAREPQRGAQEEQVQELMAQGIQYKEKIRLRDLKPILTNKTNVLGYVQGIPGSLPWGILPAYLILFFEVMKGFETDRATFIFTMFGVGATVGGILGAWAGQVLYRKDPRYLPILCGVTVLTGIIPAWILFSFPWTPDSNLLFPILFGVFTGALITVAGPNIKAILMNVNAPEHRGTVFALHNIFDAIGRGLGPLIGGFMIVAMGYQFTLYFAALMWIPCGILYLLMAWTIRKDLVYLDNYMDNKKAKLESTA